MGIKNTIVDGKGRGNEAIVTDDKAVLVTSTAIPHNTERDRVRIYRDYFRNSSGALDMRVNGSVTPQDFYIESSTDSDRYIDTISIAIADASAALNKFGNINALSNGVEIFYEDTKNGNVIIGDNLVSNFELIRLCAGGAHAIGSGSTSYRASNVQGSSEGYLMYLDFSEVFGIPWGVRLKKDTNLRLVVRINDNITGVDKF